MCIRDRIGNALKIFSDIIVIGERIEYGIKHWRLAEASTEYGGIKKGTISKKKEGEVHAIGFPNSRKPKSIFCQRKHEQNFSSYIRMFLISLIIAIYQSIPSLKLQNLLTQILLDHLYRVKVAKPILIHGSLIRFP